MRKSPELARFIADITGDGHLQFQGHRGNIQFTSKHLDHIHRFRKLSNKLFGVNPKIMRIKYDGKAFTLRYRTYFSSLKIVKELVKYDAPSGNKTNKVFFVPKWIFKGNKKLKRAYLRGMFTCEGSIFFTKGKYKPRWRIEIEQYKNEKLKDYGKQFMNQIKQMLGEFGVICSPVRYGKRNKRKDGTFSIAIKFDIEKSSFRKFNKEIGFDDKFKTKKLLNAIAG